MIVVLDDDDEEMRQMGLGSIWCLERREGDGGWMKVVPCKD